jgi:hypothetical protein
MIKSTMKIALPVAIALALSACGGSDSSTPSTSESTVVGTISGFGSIIMDNGVEYQTDGLSNCEVDDMTVAGVCEDSLSTGMHVTLRTDANGAVTSLKYDDELEGVATTVTGENGDYSFEVFGVTVTTTNPGTQWDDFNTNPPTITGLDGENVEISGVWQQDGSLLASYVEKQGDSTHEVKGTVGAITGTDFPLTLKSGSTIDVDGSALSPLPAEGDFVELKGSFDSALNLFTATDSEIEDEDDFDSDSEAEITGTLTANVDSSTGFSIGNTDVDISGASSCSGLIGLLVEAEGSYDVDTSVLVVRECENEDEDMEVKCYVTNNAVIPDETKPKVGSVECGFNGTTGGPLTIKFNDSPDMAMFSGDSTSSTFDLTDVLSGDCVEIKFSKDANGDYIAGLIEDEGTGCSSYELEGMLDSFNDGLDITVLGITFTVNSGTSYNPDKTGLVAGAKVSIKDDGANGTADEVEVH